jgi:Amino acid synthesis
MMIDRVAESASSSATPTRGVLMLFTVRKIVTVVEEIHHDLGPVPDRPAVKGAVAAIVTNPYVGKYVADLSPAADELRALGERLGNILIGHLGGDPSAIDGYGKGTIVGSAGEIEHGAMWHIPGGGGMRAALGKGTAIVPSTKKVAGVGARLDVPITHLEWSYVGSHYDAIEVGVPDGPKPDEMVVILAMAIGGRVHARLAGGFTLADRGKPGVPA